LKPNEDNLRSPHILEMQKADLSDISISPNNSCYSMQHS